MAFQRIFLEGDKDAAAKLIREAQGVLYKARALLQAGSPIAGVTNRFGGGSYAQALILPGQEVLRIFAPAPQPQLVPTVEFVDFPIYSGLVRTIGTGGDIVPIPLVPSGTEYRLRSYRPTEEAWSSALNKRPANPPSAFNDIAELTVRLFGSSPTSENSQYQTIYASMYSGLMCKVVQLLLGYGRINVELMEGLEPDAVASVVTNGLQIQYDYRWSRSHIIARGQDNALWLVEISQSNGVIALPLPMLANDLGDPDNIEENVLREAAELLGGLPSGYLPSGPQFSAMLAAGDAIRLASAADLDDFYTKLEPSALLGWSTSSSGAEAHNTCFHYAEGIFYGSHYKVTITIGPKKQQREENEPLAAGNAVLSLVSTGRCPMLEGVFAFGHESGFSSSSENWTGYYAQATDCPLLAVHIDNQLRVVRYDRHVDAGYLSASVYDQHLVPQGQGVKVISASETASFSSFVYEITHDEDYNPVERTANRYVVDLTYTATGGRAVGLWPQGARDAYIIVREGAVVIEYHFNGVGYPPDDAHLNSESGYWSYAAQPPSSHILFGDGHIISRTWGVPFLDSDTNSGTYGYGFGIGYYPPGHLVDDWATAGGTPYRIGFSVLGVPHYTDPAYRRDGGNSGAFLEGPLFSGEPNPSPHRYNFIGYT